MAEEEQGRLIDVIRRIINDKKRRYIARDPHTKVKR
jgi:sulfate adenylyltransferase subunit 1 (EFTu-like GTPase family)